MLQAQQSIDHLWCEDNRIAGETWLKLVWAHTALELNDRVLDHNLMDSGVKTYVARSDIEAKGIKTDIGLLDYGVVMDVIFDLNRVVCW